MWCDAVVGIYGKTLVDNIRGGAALRSPEGRSAERQHEVGWLLGVDQGGGRSGDGRPAHTGES